MTLGQTIKEKQEELNWTQQELAQKLFVSRQTVCRWENGTRCPDIIMCKKIALVFGISLDALIPTEDLGEDMPSSLPAVDLSCVKVMLTGMMLLLVGTFLLVADKDNMDFGALSLFLGIAIFVVGLFIPADGRGKVVVNDNLPQRKCPRCGKSHDFDYPKCPHCGYDEPQKR